MCTFTGTEGSNPSLSALKHGEALSQMREIRKVEKTIYNGEVVEWLKTAVY
jgi:hypothetical protein